MTISVRLPDMPALPAVVVVDLDGTLLDPQSVLRPRTRVAVEALLERDVPIVVATARALRSVRARLGVELLARVSLIHMNGVAFSAEGAPSEGSRLPLHPAPSPGRVSRHPPGGSRWERVGVRVPLEVATRVLALATSLAPRARVVCEIEGEAFGCDVALDADALWATNSATPDMVIPLAEAIARGAAKIAVNGLGEPLGDLLPRLRDELGEHVDVIVDADGTFANVVPRGVSKHAALEVLLGRADPWAGMLAFGDDMSDFELLRRAEYGVAMANAHPEVLRVARYRTLSNDEEGVAQVLERLIARHG